jgi:hypothetical protein
MRRVAEHEPKRVVVHYRKNDWPGRPAKDSHHQERFLQARSQKVFRALTRRIQNSRRIGTVRSCDTSPGNTAAEEKPIRPMLSASAWRRTELALARHRRGSPGLSECPNATIKRHPGKSGIIKPGGRVTLRRTRTAVQVQFLTRKKDGAVNFPMVALMTM